MPDNAEVHVGVLGYGLMGEACGTALRQLGYSVSAWTHTRKELTGVEPYVGPDQLDGMLARCNLLVCTLPLTEDTRRAGVVNVARGAHLVERDLLQALDSGQVGYACLDVFRQEPLPPESRYEAIRLCAYSRTLAL